ncbi:MAG: methylated-DNA-[protein]-cysteine S-methyltransferase [Paraglaciecola sp.]|jgi:methylated-DNA-[protein]-cysteine S-methyltransferase
MKNLDECIEYYDSPIGILRIAANINGLTAIVFVEERQQSAKPNAVTNMAKIQLAEYFAGTRQQFDLPSAVQGTDFQRQVWQQLKTIPYGKTSSYQDIARQIDNPKAVRAVGSANGKNPLTIVVPCHRVIGADGSLTGYAWGVSRKAQLLELETRNA